MNVVRFAPSTGHGARAIPRAVRGAVSRHVLRAVVGGLAGTVRLWRRRARDRAQLAMLDDRMLRDIGVSRVDIWGEIHKPFWRK